MPLDYRSSYRTFGYYTTRTLQTRGFLPVLLILSRTSKLNSQMTEREVQHDEKDFPRSKERINNRNPIEN